MTEEDGGPASSSSSTSKKGITEATTNDNNNTMIENDDDNINEAFSDVVFSDVFSITANGVRPMMMVSPTRITNRLLSGLMSQQAVVVVEDGDDDEQQPTNDDYVIDSISNYVVATQKVEEELMGDDDDYNNLTLTNGLGSESEEVMTTTTTTTLLLTSNNSQQLQERHQQLQQQQQIELLNNRRREKRRTVLSRGVGSDGAVKKEEDGVIITPQLSTPPSSPSRVLIMNPTTIKATPHTSSPPSSPSRRKEIRDKIRNKQRQQRILDITTTPNGASTNSSSSSSLPTPPRPPSPHSSSSSRPVGKVAIPKAFSSTTVVVETKSLAISTSPPPRPMTTSLVNNEARIIKQPTTCGGDDDDNDNTDAVSDVAFSDVAFSDVFSSTTANGSSRPMMNISPTRMNTRLLLSGLLSQQQQQQQQQQQVIVEYGDEYGEIIINGNIGLAAVTNREEVVVVLGGDAIEEKEEGGDDNVSRRTQQLLTDETELFPNAALVEKYDGDQYFDNNNNDEDRSNIIFDNTLDDKAFWEKAESVFISRSSSSLGIATCDDLADNAAWDTTGAVEMNEILEQTKARNKEIKTKFGAVDNSSQPLLRLETDGEEEATMYSSSASAAKLLLQKERVDMYNNGGFGVGDDSSVDNDDRDEEEQNSRCDVDDEDKGNNNYQVVDDEIEYEDHPYNVEEEVIAMETCQMVDNFAEFSPLLISQSDNQWDRIPDAIQSEEVEDESRTTLRAKPRKVDVPISVSSSSVKSPNKIPPPPPEKLRKWEESKGIHARQSSVSMTSQDTSTTTTNTTDDYKIHISKSPKRSAKKSHSLIEELDLAGHKRMVKKIVLATTKAATKFEEQYPSLEHTTSSESHGGSPEPVCELTRGAFSPWKIPDGAEADDDGSIATSAWTVCDNESNARSNDNNQKIGSSLAASPLIRSSTPINECFEVSLGDDGERSLALVLRWLFDVVLPDSPIAAAYSAFDINAAVSVQSDRVLAIACDGNNFNLICEYVDSILTDMDQGFEGSYFLTSNGATPRSDELAGFFVDWLQRISKVTGIPSPFSGMNPFSQSIAYDGIPKKPAAQSTKGQKSIQDLIFTNEDRVIAIFQFLLKACKGSVVENVRHVLSIIDEDHIDVIDPYSTPTKVAATTATLRAASPTDKQARVQSTTIRKSNKRYNSNQKSTRLKINPTYVVPAEHPSPFEKAVWSQPSIVISILSFLGDPVSVCVAKRLNVFCNRIVSENQHVLMRDAVRLGGMNKFKRPSFWLWVTEMCKPEDPIPRQGSEPKYCGNDFHKLKDLGAKGRWQHHIERDVTRSFGNMPPHKTGARYRQDSIVRALVSFGKETIIRNSRSYINMESNSHIMDKVPEGLETEHFKLSSRVDCRDDSSHGSSGSHTPTDTVSEWPAISPVGSLVSEEPSLSVVRFDDNSIQIVSSENGEILETNEIQPQNNWNLQSSNSQVSDPVLSCNALTNEMKIDLQNKLRTILHALAARHEGVGYCQGMDYIVAHLLRVLQDTILLRVVQQSMPIGQDNLEWRSMSSDEKNCILRARMSDINFKSAIVEEVVFDVMDTFFLTYNLQHMYWPELRCLKTCCRVFENVIRQKLPVLADHFEHHDMNVGLFALGWFQTLFLYLPSMPSATVCHIWDIWLVERSFKIFFRVGTAILFLSQPTLLNHDLEGMMTYLNTFPDATLLRRDILIPCALQIKITNRMLVEIEIEVTKPNELHDEVHGNDNEYF